MLAVVIVPRASWSTSVDETPLTAPGEIVRAAPTEVRDRRPIPLSSPAPDPFAQCQIDPARLPPLASGRTFHTCGARILSDSGQPVQITGVSWFGMETGTYAPHGLWTRNWKTMLDQIAGLGFNTIRLPFTNEALIDGQMPKSINYDVNPDLKGKTSLQVMDMIIEGAGERGLKVILDRHRPTSEAQSELWYTDKLSEDRWIQDWVMLAARYRGNSTVIGMDLHNEPRGPATWGSGDQASDWRLAAERAGNAVLQANPYLLIFVQGVERMGDDFYWWGGNLEGARDNPVRLQVPGRLVYSPHAYGPSVYAQPWFQDPDFPNNLSVVWDTHWGYLAEQQVAPVVLGEFGGRSVGDDADGIWQRNLIQYLKQHDIGWINWSFNPDSSDTGGLLAEDWLTIEQGKAQLYQQYLAPALDVGTSGVFGRPTPHLSVRADNKLQNNQWNVQLQIVNDGPDPLDPRALQVRYSYRPGSMTPKSTEVVEVDYADVGTKMVRGTVGPAGPNGEASVTLSFMAGARDLPPYTTSAIALRVHKSDWSPYPNGATASADAVAVYRDGQPVGGAEPKTSGADSAPQGL